MKSWASIFPDHIGQSRQRQVQFVLKMGLASAGRLHAMGPQPLCNRRRERADARAWVKQPDRLPVACWGIESEAMYRAIGAGVKNCPCPPLCARSSGSTARLPRSSRSLAGKLPPRRLRISRARMSRHRSSTHTTRRIHGSLHANKKSLKSSSASMWLTTLRQVTSSMCRLALFGPLPRPTATAPASASKFG